MDDPRVEEHMLRLLRFETAPARRTAAKTLGNLKSETAVEPLVGSDAGHKEHGLADNLGTALGLQGRALRRGRGPLPVR